MRRKYKKYGSQAISVLLAAGLSLQIGAGPGLAVFAAEPAEIEISENGSAPEENSQADQTILTEEAVNALEENDVDVKGMAREEGGQQGSDCVIGGQDEAEPDEGRVDRICRTSLENMVRVRNTGHPVSEDPSAPGTSAKKQKFEGEVLFTVDLNTLFRAAESQWQEVLDLHFGRPDSWRVMGQNSSQATVDLEVELPEGFTARKGTSVCDSQYLEKITTEPLEGNKVKVTVFLTEMEYIDGLIKSAQAGTAGSAELAIPIEGTIQKGEALDQKVVVTGQSVLEHMTGFMIPLTLNVEVDPLEAPIVETSSASQNTGTGIQKLSEKTDGSAEEKSVSISTNHTASPTSTGGWNDDEFTFRRNIDLYSELSINDKYRETVEPGEAFILTSDLDVCRISDILDKQIAKNEEIYGNIENAPLSNIEFAFTAEYDFDPDIDISNIHYDFFDYEGYDGPFQITDIERSAQSNHIQVTFGLDTEFSTVGDLKQAALDTGDYLKLNISGLKVSEDCGVKNTDLQIYGDVYGYLNADVAVNDRTTLHAIVNFSTWSSPRACVLVQETWNFNKSFNLDSWMSSSESSYGSVWTRYDQPFAITGHLDTSRIRRALESTASRSRAIHVVDVPPCHISDLTFTAVFTLPKGIEWTAEEALPELNNAEDFAIQNIEQDGKKITVTMGLADPESIDDVYDLYEIEQRTPEHLELTMGGFRVTEDNRYSGGSNTYTIYGRVSGTLKAEAETF